MASKPICKSPSIVCSRILLTPECSMVVCHGYSRHGIYFQILGEYETARI